MKTVLIVDDHAEIRRLLRMTLENQDVALHEAASGEAALAVARAALRCRCGPGSARGPSGHGRNGRA
ncbi:hypothetical protein [Paracidovorax avenae]|uniref:hypothetical protein n=1 Tax=Paracidovorax avenae TaxID=80867 RepID=UPI001CEF5B41|nr:hypothetical protein [Paracidovorax avenae]